MFEVGEGFLRRLFLGRKTGYVDAAPACCIGVRMGENPAARLVSVRHHLVLGQAEAP